MVVKAVSDGASTSTSLSTTASQWFGKMMDSLSQIRAPSFEKAEMIDLAHRVKWVVALGFVSLVFLAVRYRTTSTAKPEEDLSPTLSGEIGKDVLRIDRAFEALLKNLPGLKGPQGQEFQQQLNQFYGLYKKEEHTQQFVFVDSLNENYQLLLEMKGALFFTRSSLDASGIMSAPADGNCLFHVLGRGLALLEPTLKQKGQWNDFPFDHTSMRQRITTWMKAHLSDEALQKHINAAIAEYVPILKKQQETEQASIEIRAQTEDVTELRRAYDKKQTSIQILEAGGQKAWEAYIEMTSQDGNFASSPQIYAFCQLNPNIGVHIYRRIQMKGQQGEIISKDFDLPFNDKAPFSIKVLYNVTGDHFDQYLKD